MKPTIIFSLMTKPLFEINGGGKETGRSDTHICVLSNVSSSELLSHTHSLFSLVCHNDKANGRSDCTCYLARTIRISCHGWESSLFGSSTSRWDPTRTTIFRSVTNETTRKNKARTTICSTHRILERRILGLFSVWCLSSNRLELLLLYHE